LQFYLKPNDFLVNSFIGYFVFEIVSIYSSIKQITNGTNKLINYRYGILIKTHRKAVNEMSQLPGIGKRTALRLVLHLLKQPKEQTGFIASLSCDAGRY
jgi:hypothetical protein